MTFPNWLSGLRPRMKEVHHYKVLDPATGEWIIPPLKCTAERIAQMNGKIINGTMNVVSRSSLDNNGCYDPGTARDKPRTEPDG
jgi:hypothetical protein